ncbi:hypothetical protein J5N97_001509 [Dioscorea zingiberensis]|uniref:Peptidase M41 domain-containing protein n=1 Tax=Dioscorea zingiberensis TaxID=325984 RepID=A0A9D5H277_9LILI|nr:hypothetical protein J5N97_001509 [Dioscorea zingiberensis]
MTTERNRLEILGNGLEVLVTDAAERLLATGVRVGHEAGHALVGALMPEYDPVAKISIIPRGQAGGLTFFAPSEERGSSLDCTAGATLRTRWPLLLVEGKSQLHKITYHPTQDYCYNTKSSIETQGG